ncbi:polysaccharide biosynthesis protein [Candidatus Saccharibacteria bacterium]|nr:polysaccharide biosynthesis protein [Candidatus Saccharibacteria bacterium]
MSQKLSRRKTLVIGAGKAGGLLVEDMQSKTNLAFDVIGFLDDAVKIGTKISGVPVLGTLEEIQKVAEQNEIEEIIIAIPRADGSLIRSIVESSKGIKLSYKILPRSSEVLLQDFAKDYTQHLRNLEIDDLFGGSIDKLDLTRVSERVQKETFLITGAAGSIGSELSRQIASQGAKKIIFYDWWENGMFELRNELIERHPEGDFEFVIGDIKDAKKIGHTIAKYKPDTIFHAAAYKHVPLMEANGIEAIKNNIIGTRTVAKAAVRHQVSKFVLVSTDKAVNPTNIMGATKRAAEKMIHILSETQDTTKFCAVRFGNVMNSNGSVIPIFKRQIDAGGPVGVTHKDINRFFMTIPEAVMLILRAWMIGENNDLFVLDMGEPIRIYNLAEWMIVLKGLVPHKDIAINVIGLRPGEKLYEEVLVEQESVDKTSEKGIFRTRNYMDFDKITYLNTLAYLEEAIQEGDVEREEVHRYLQKMITTFKPAEHSK